LEREGRVVLGAINWIWKKWRVPLLERGKTPFQKSEKDRENFFQFFSPTKGGRGEKLTTPLFLPI